MLNILKALWHNGRVLYKSKIWLLFWLNHFLKIYVILTHVNPIKWFSGSVNMF